MKVTYDEAGQIVYFRFAKGDGVKFDAIDCEGDVYALKSTRQINKNEYAFGKDTTLNTLENYKGCFFITTKWDTESGNHVHLFHDPVKVREFLDEVIEEIRLDQESHMKAYEYLLTHPELEDVQRTLKYLQANPVKKNLKFRPIPGHFVPFSTYKDIYVIKNHFKAGAEIGDIIRNTRDFSWITGKK